MAIEGLVKYQWLGLPAEIVGFISNLKSKPHESGCVDRQKILIKKGMELIQLGLGEVSNKRVNQIFDKWKASTDPYSG